jgi:hypothetical protein
MFQLLRLLNLELDGDARLCLNNYLAVRDRFVNELSLDKNAQEEAYQHVPNRAAHPSHDILLAEVIGIKFLIEYLRKL